MVDANNRPIGDKPFLDVFREKILPAAQRNIDIGDVAQNMFSLYPIAMKKTLGTLPSFFFKAFFKFNENFAYKNRDLNLSVKLKYKKENEGERSVFYFVMNLWFKQTYRNNEYREDLSIEVNFEQLVKRVIDEDASNHNQCSINELTLIKLVYEKLLSELTQRLETKRAELFSQSKYSVTMKKRSELFCRNVLSNLRLQFNYNYEFPFDAHQIEENTNTFSVFEQQPFLRFGDVLESGEYTMQVRDEEGVTVHKDLYYDDLVRSNGLLWFSYFVYGLRNILFHEIIDPLDREWQKIFKYSYLILKPIVDACVLEVTLKNTAVAEKEVSYE